MKIEQIISSLHKYKLLIFDADSTIVKLAVDWKPYREQMRTYAREKLHLQFGQERLDEMEAYIVKELGVQALKDALFIRRQAEEVGLDQIDLNDSIAEIIKTIANHKLALQMEVPIFSVLSNNLDATVTNALHKVGLHKYFDSIIGLESAGYFPKPNSDGTQKILNMYNVSPNETLFIGDSDRNDKAVAQELGIDYVKVIW